VFSIRRGHQVQRFLQKCGWENPFFCVHLQIPPRVLPWSAEETERSELQGLASPWDTIPINAQDATYQRSAATTQQEASIGAKRNTKHTKGTSKSNDTNLNL